MHLSATRIRSINRAIARVNGIICGESDRMLHRQSEIPKFPRSAIQPLTIKVVAVRRPATA